MTDTNVKEGTMGEPLTITINTGRDIILAAVAWHMAEKGEKGRQRNLLRDAVQRHLDFQEFVDNLFPDPMPVWCQRDCGRPAEVAVQMDQDRQHDWKMCQKCANSPVYASMPHHPLEK